MTATKTLTQDEASAIAARHGYRVEVHRMTTGDVWDIRIYWTGETYTKTSYDRRRDVRAADIPNRILAMVAVAVHGLPWGTKLTTEEALGYLA